MPLRFTAHFPSSVAPIESMRPGPGISLLPRTHHRRIPYGHNLA